MNIVTVSETEAKPQSRVRLLDETDVPAAQPAISVKPLLLIGTYFGVNMALTLQNKWILSHFASRAGPWLLSALHISVSGLGGWILLVGREQEFERRRTRFDAKMHLKLAFFSTLYSMNIALSNVGLVYVSLAFHQLVRSAGPIMTLILELLVLGKKPKMGPTLALIPVVVGLVLVVYGGNADGKDNGSMEFTVVGLVLCALGLVLASLKGVLTHSLLTGPLKMHPLELIWRLAPLATFQCLVAAVLSEDMAEMLALREPKASPVPLALGIASNGLMAFFLNWISFVANKSTSPVSLAVAGNVKQAVTILLAVYLFSTPVSLVGGIGIFLTLLGGAVYSLLSIGKKQ